jgi:rifampin ADP-ribosylating transferase
MESNLKDGIPEGPFYHGTKATFKPGDLITPGYSSNFGKREKANFVYMSATMDAAIWGAELAQGTGKGRIYCIEPTGEFEDDPNLTDKKFPGNPTKSYRTKYSLRVLNEVLEWDGHPPDVLQQMLDHLEGLKKQGIEAIND